jgi:hypothetical protein
LDWMGLGQQKDVVTPGQNENVSANQTVSHIRSATGASLRQVERRLAPCFGLVQRGLWPGRLEC